jgi:hypothetical protein
MAVHSYAAVLWDPRVAAFESRNPHPADRHGHLKACLCRRDADSHANGATQGRRHRLANSPQKPCCGPVAWSRHGAGVLSKHKLVADSMPILRFLGGNSEASIRLVGLVGEDIRAYVHGVASVDSTLDFRELKFPPPRGRRVPAAIQALDLGSGNHRLQRATAGVNYILVAEYAILS